MYDPRDKAAPESLSAMIDELDYQVYERLRAAVELGKWPDGKRLPAEQIEQTLQLLILYEARHLPAAQRVLSNLPSGCGRGPSIGETGESGS